jgi:TRAP-type mannitol/chloroaromatic compound transport system permease small subunit
MRRLYRLADFIDRLSDRLGRWVSWLILAMVLVGAANAVGRYAGRSLGLNLSSNAALELQWYLFSLVFLLAAGYTLKRDSHVRVDVIYGRLSAKMRSWIDLLGGVLFLLPFCIFSLWVSWPSVRNSWAVFEQSPDPGGLARYPIKSVILVAFALLALQGLAQVIHSVGALRGDLPTLEVEEADGDGLGSLGASAGEPHL